MTELRFHHSLVIGHLEEGTRVGLQHDLARLVQILMPVAHNIPFTRIFHHPPGETSSCSQIVGSMRQKALE